MGDAQGVKPLDDALITAQRSALVELGVAPDRIYTDHGLTGRTRARPGLDKPLQRCARVTRSS